MIQESNDLEGMDIAEAYNKLSPRIKGKALKNFPNGKFKRYSREAGVTKGRGTFMLGEKDFVDESFNVVSQYSDSVDNAAHGKPRKVLHGKERINPYVKKPKESPKAADGMTIKRKVSRIQLEIQNKLKEYGIN
jgi:hypothetical protein